MNGLQWQGLELSGGSMVNPLGFDRLVQALHRVLDQLPDTRRGKNISYAVKDAALGAFAVFFTQSPSFLAHQQALHQAKGSSNAHSLFGITQIPCDNQIRTLLDRVPPSHIFPIFRTISHALLETGLIKRFHQAHLVSQLLAENECGGHGFL
jgi:hypothetical protein